MKETTGIESGSCEICGRVFEGKNKAIVARSIGVHKRVSHGIKSTRKNYYVKVADRNRLDPYSSKLEERRAKDREYKKRKREEAARIRNGMFSSIESAANPPAPQPLAKPENMNVAICPRCHCRFATMIIEEGQVL